MESIKEIINFFKNLTKEQLINIAIGLAFIIVFKIIGSFLAYILVKMFNFKVKDKKEIKANSFYKPLKIFFGFLGIYIALRILRFPDYINYYIDKVFKIITIILITNGLANIFNPKSKLYAKIRKKLHFKGNDTLISFAGKVIKAFIYIISGFIIITELGYNLGGLATGLGISSVVVALAAQDVAKNILSGVSIISDKPFEIGDYIQVGDFCGTVEDITFRTTRIRNINNEIVVLPNSVINGTSLINCSKRKKRRYEIRLVLELNTPLNKISTLLDTIRKYCIENEHILDEAVRVYLDTISDSGIDVSVGFYTDIIEFDDFLKFKEEINYTLLSMLEKQKIELAYPSQSIYLKKD